MSDCLLFYRRKTNDKNIHIKMTKYESYSRKKCIGGLDSIFYKLYGRGHFKAYIVILCYEPLFLILWVVGYKEKNVLSKPPIHFFPGITFMNLLKKKQFTYTFIKHFFSFIFSPKILILKLVNV